MQRIWALCLSLSVAAMWAMCLQPISSHADEHEETEKKKEIKFERIVGMQFGGGEIRARGSIPNPIGGTIAYDSESSGSGVGIFIGDQYIYPNNWILGGQINYTYERYDNLRVPNYSGRTKINASVFDFLARVSYDSGRIRPFVVIGPNFFVSSGTFEGTLVGLKTGFGVDFILGFFFLSLGYYYSNHPEIEIDYVTPAGASIGKGKLRFGANAGRLSLGYRF